LIGAIDAGVRLTGRWTWHDPDVDVRHDRHGRELRCGALQRYSQLTDGIGFREVIAMNFQLLARSFQPGPTFG
jgi:hypothetical protein